MPRDGFEIDVETGSLIVLAGVSGVGKSTLAAEMFTPDMVVCADRFRWMISGDEGDQSVTPQAWEMTNRLIEHRLDRGNTTVVDSLALQARARRSLVDMARRVDKEVHLIMLWADLETCLQGQQSRERQVPAEVVERMFMQAQELREMIRAGALADEGFASAQIIVRNQVRA